MGTHSKAEQQAGLADTRVANQEKLEQVVAKRVGKGKEGVSTNKTQPRTDTRMNTNTNTHTYAQTQMVPQLTTRGSL